jgi:SAM-dependent methyltransferase
MVERTRQRATQSNIGNILYVVRDVFATGFGQSASKDSCLLFNILHCEQPVRLFTEAARVIRPAGYIYIIHWRYDPAKPRGPSMDIRPRPEQIQHWTAETGLRASPEGVVDLPPWHCGICLHSRTI